MNKQILGIHHVTAIRGCGCGSYRYLLPEILGCSVQPFS